MTQREKFFETVGILVEAYLNDTLVHGDPCGCGFGNVVAKKLGAKVVVDANYHHADLDRNARWVNNNSGHRAYNWYEFLRGQESLNLPDNASGRHQVYMTGYTINEAIRIERAFESVINTTGGDEDPDGYEGLMAVVNELASIHSIDLTERESAKLLFKKESV